jgi:hypothetical protein
MQNKFLTKSMAMKITRNNGSQRKDLTSGSIVHLYSYLQNDTTVQVNELIHGCLGHGQMLRIDRRILRRPTVFSGSAFTAGKPDIYIEGVGCPNLCLLRSSPTLLSSMSSIQNKVQNVLRFADEHHQRIFRVSYIALILPVLILTSMLMPCLFPQTVVPLLSPLFLQLPNADVVEFQLRRSLATIDIGYYSSNTQFKENVTPTADRLWQVFA